MEGAEKTNQTGEVAHTWVNTACMRPVSSTAEGWGLPELPEAVEDGKEEDEEEPTKGNGDGPYINMPVRTVISRATTNLWWKGEGRGRGKRKGEEQGQGKRQGKRKDEEKGKEARERERERRMRNG